MLKRLCLAFAGLFALLSIAQGAGTVPGFSLTPQFDLTGKIAPGCLLYIIQAGTVSTPQNAYQDTGLSILQTNPILCDSAGRLPQWFVADGTIKLRLTDKNGVQLFVGDNLLVVGPSSGGGGGGGTVDPTTVMQPCDIKVVYGTGVLSGFVRANGRTVGSATSGATERANADTQALFTCLYNADPNLVVSGGRGVSAAADFAANKTIALPDWRGRALAGLGDMGNVDAGRITAGYFGSSPIVLGSAGGSQSQALTTQNLPPYTPSGSVGSFLSNGNPANVWDGSASVGVPATGANAVPTVASFHSLSGTFTGTPQGGTSTPFSTLQPMLLATIYIKM